MSPSNGAQFRAKRTRNLPLPSPPRTRLPLEASLVGPEVVEAVEVVLDEVVPQPEAAVLTGVVSSTVTLPVLAVPVPLRPLVTYPLPPRPSPPNLNQLTCQNRCQTRSRTSKMAFLRWHMPGQTRSLPTPKSQARLQSPSQPRWMPAHPMHQHP